MPFPFVKKTVLISTNVKTTLITLQNAPNERMGGRGEGGGERF